MREMAVRCSDGVVETATWELTHPSGRRVVLVGMMHLGDPEYYQQIGEVLQELSARKAVIQYERIKKRPEEELQELSEEEQTQVRKLREAIKEHGSGVFAEALGLSFQGSRLTYPPGAENVDIDDVTLMQALGYAQVRKLFVHKKLEESEKETLREVLRFVLTNYRWLSPLVSLLPGGRRRKKVILEDRNTLALDAIRPHLQEGDVALVWGAAHLPGLREGLEREGYQVTEKTWEQVCTL